MRHVVVIVVLALSSPAVAEWDTVVDRGYLADISFEAWYTNSMLADIHNTLIETHNLMYYRDQREQMMASDLNSIRQFTQSSLFELGDINDRLATVVSLLTSIEGRDLTVDMSGVESRLNLVNDHLVNLESLVGVVQTNTGETVAELVQANEWLADVHSELMGLRDDLAPLLDLVDDDGLNVKLKDMDVLIEAIEAIQGGADMSTVESLLQEISEALHFRYGSALETTLADMVNVIHYYLASFLNHFQDSNNILTQIRNELQSQTNKMTNMEAHLGVIQTNTGETVAELVRVNQYLESIEGFSAQTAAYLEAIDIELQLQGLALEDLLVEHEAQGLDILAIRDLLEAWLDQEEPGSVGGGETPGFQMPGELGGNELYPTDWTDYPTEAEMQRDLMEFQLGQYRKDENIYLEQNYKVETDRPISDGNHIFSFDFSSLFAALGVNGLPTSWQWELKSDWYDAHLRTWVFTAGILFASWSVAWMIWAETRKG